MEERAEPMGIGGYPVIGLVRAARRRGDLSQREMARAVRVHPSTIGRIEGGALIPSMKLFSEIMGAAGCYLTVVDEAGRVLLPMEDRDDLLDGAERRYPSHLDVIPDPRSGEWWADVYGLTRPPETFNRDRATRDERRRRSQWEVRVAQLRNAPEPPEPIRYW